MIHGQFSEGAADCGVSKEEANYFPMARAGGPGWEGLDESPGYARYPTPFTAEYSPGALDQLIDGWFACQKRRGYCMERHGQRRREYSNESDLARLSPRMRAVNNRAMKSQSYTFPWGNPGEAQPNSESSINAKLGAIRRRGHDSRTRNVRC